MNETEFFLTSEAESSAKFMFHSLGGQRDGIVIGADKIAVHAADAFMRGDDKLATELRDIADILKADAKTLSTEIERWRVEMHKQREICLAKALVCP